MSIKSILKYQEEDMKLNSLDKKLSNSEAYKGYNAYSKELLATQDEAKTVARRLTELFALIDNHNSTIQKSYAEVSEIAEAANDFEELKEVDLFEKKIDRLQKQMETIERDVQKSNREIKEIEAEGKKLYNKILACKKHTEKFKLDFQTLRQAQQVERQAITKELESLSSSVDATLLAKYLDIRKSGKMPIIVKVDGFDCGGCHMEVDRSVVDGLVKGLAECPNCGRLIYKL